MNIDLWNEYKTTGSRMALNTMVTAEMPFVRKCVRRFTKGRARDNDFEDLVQNACLGLLSAIDKWHPERGRWEPYAYLRIRVMLQRTIPQQVMMRGAGVGDVLFDDEEDTMFRKLSTASVSEQETLLDEMMAAVQQLPADERKVIEMRFLEDLPLRTVASALGVSRMTVDVLEKRAVERLRRAA